MKWTAETKKKFNMIARVYENKIKAQAPGNNIKGGTSVVVEYDKDSVSLAVVLADNVFYGIFLDQGTGPYYKANVERGPFNPRPGKGTGGIIPRFWMSLSEALEQRTQDELNQAILDQRAEEEEKKFNDTVIEITLDI
jgi:hypothetical protein